MPKGKEANHIGARSSSIKPIPTTLQKVNLVSLPRKNSLIDTIIESMNQSQWTDFSTALDNPNPDITQLTTILNTVSKENDLQHRLKPIRVTYNQVRSWYESYSQGEIAKSLQDEVGQYKHLPTLGILEKLVCDSIVESQSIAERVFSPDADITDKDLLKTLPQLRNTAIKGVQALQQINSVSKLNNAKVEGAILLGRRIAQVFDGSPMEQLVRDTITQTIIDIETYQI